MQALNNFHLSIGTKKKKGLVLLKRIRLVVHRFYFATPCFFVSRGFQWLFSKLFSLVTKPLFRLQNTWRRRLYTSCGEIVCSTNLTSFATILGRHEMVARKTNPPKHKGQKKLPKVNSMGNIEAKKKRHFRRVGVVSLFYDAVR